MRMILTVKLPVDPFNTAVRDGNVGKTIARILDKTKPETVYFTEFDGRRGAFMIYNVDNPSQIPSLAEPWFLNFNAECHFQIAMNPDDLQKAGLEELGKKWG